MLMMSKTWSIWKRLIMWGLTVAESCSIRVTSLACRVDIVVTAETRASALGRGLRAQPGLLLRLLQKQGVRVVIRSRARHFLMLCRHLASSLGTRVITRLADHPVQSAIVVVRALIARMAS